MGPLEYALLGIGLYLFLAEPTWTAIFILIPLSLALTTAALLTAR